MTADTVEIDGGGGGLAEKRVVGLGGRVVSNKIVKKKKRCQRKQQVPIHIHIHSHSHSQSAFPRLQVLQRLFWSCLHIFKAPHTLLSPTHVHRLQRILDAMLPEDVGLNQGMQFFKPQNVVEGTARVTYATIYHCKDFSLSLFFLPASAVIPLHNHPEMTVFSKLLLGTMHIKSYDWVEPAEFDNSMSAASSKLRLARLKTNKVLSSPCDSSVLYPTCGGNIHEMKALTPCAVLDVLGPPYSKSDGRDCSYYREWDTPYGKMEKEEEKKSRLWNGCAWLEEIETPQESEMDVIPYMGPPVFL